MIKQIVAHGSPAHLDEVAAAYMIRTYGEKQFPGAKTAIFRTLEEKDNLEELKKLEASGEAILLGFGGGPFDEHYGGEEKSAECCSTLIAKRLGIENDYAWARVLKAILHTDKHAPNLQLDLSTSVVRFQRQGLPLSAVYDYTEITIQAALADFWEFGQTSLKEVKQYPIEIKGRETSIAVAETDNKGIAKFLKFFGTAVVIVKNGNGHIQVIINKEFNLDARDMLRMLRILEQEKNQNGKKPITDWKILEEESYLQDISQWYLHRDSNCILNGGESRPDIPVTKLSLDEVREVVEIALSDKFCVSCAGEKCFPRCQWRKLGLIRCRSARYAIATNPQ